MQRIFPNICIYSKKDVLQIRAEQSRAHISLEHKNTQTNYSSTRNSCIKYWYWFRCHLSFERSWNVKCALFFLSLSSFFTLYPICIYLSLYCYASAYVYVILCTNFHILINWFLFLKDTHIHRECTAKLKWNLLCIHSVFVLIAFEKIWFMSHTHIEVYAYVPFFFVADAPFTIILIWYFRRIRLFCDMHLIILLLLWNRTLTLKLIWFFILFLHKFYARVSS